MTLIQTQTLKKIEFLIVDDDSPDNRGKICDDYAKKDDTYYSTKKYVASDYIPEEKVYITKEEFRKNAYKLFTQKLCILH